MKDVMKLTITGIVVVAVILAALTLLAGLGSERHESQYSGQVVDVENQKGLILQTSQAKLKTDSRSSQHETFCIHPDNREQLDPLQKALRDGDRVTITYERPRYVPVWTCQQETSIITDIEVSEEGTDR